MQTFTDSFPVHKGDYKRLTAFQKAECIYDITCYFLDHYPPQIGDRITFAFQPPKKGKITKRLQKCENNAIKEKKNCTIVRHIKKLT